MIELLILYILLKHDLTMYSIHKRIQESFRVFYNSELWSTKPALVRLEKEVVYVLQKIMSDGGKLSVFYSITKDGIRELKNYYYHNFQAIRFNFYQTQKVKSLLCIFSK